MEATWRYGLELTFQGICCKQERIRCLLGGVSLVVDKRGIKVWRQNILGIDSGSIFDGH